MALRCVVVEDQGMFLELLVAMLRTMQGLEVVGTAQGVSEAIAVCQRHRPELLILDLALPDGHGLDVLAATQLQTDPPRTIVLSGQASSFVCPRELRPQLEAVIDKTRAFHELNTAIRPLLQAHDAGIAAPDSSLLTTRERQVFALIGKGCTNRSIADQLGLSLRTVETHRKNVNQKLGAKGSELVRLATLELQRGGLVGEG